MLRKLRSKESEKHGFKWVNYGSYYSWVNQYGHGTINTATANALINKGMVELHYGVYKVSAAGEAVEL